MKRNGLLWLLMLALIVPALALSGCKEKKHSRDKDDDESSSSSTEKVERKKKKDKEDIDITGRYELDEASVKAMLGDNTGGLGDDAKFRCVLDLGDYENLKLDFIIDASMYSPDLYNTMIISTDLSGTGTWKYDKGDKILTINISNASLANFDVRFAENKAKTNAIIKQAGGMEKFKTLMRNELAKSFDSSAICGIEEFKITELTDFGFYARTVSGEIQKVRFERVN